MNTDIFEVDYADNGIFGIIEGGPSKVQQMATLF